ncbi:MAG TPA: extracellular solute-binding protein [Treponemataceae bacterium]|nr:extracellular solute-binding protein [Treponemataceae bacterium]
MKKSKKLRSTAKKTAFSAWIGTFFSEIRSRKWVLPVFAGTILLVVGGVFLFSWITRPKKPGIAFYHIPPNLVEALTQSASNTALSGETGFTFLALDDSLPLGEQLENQKNRISVLFAPVGQAPASLASEVSAPAERIRRLLPTTIRNAGSSGKNVYALPILLDHFELACSKAILSRNNASEPKSISEMLETARKVKTKRVWPIICAGSRDQDLLLLVGTLMHTQYGLDAYRLLVTEIRKGSPFDTILSETRLADVLETLLSWRRDRLLHPQWLEMTGEDLAAFMRFDNAVFVFMPLSARRNLDPKTAEKYTSIAVPPEVKASSYPLTAPVYAGMRIRNELFADAAEQFLYSLVQEEAQIRLSRDTGLAPANAKAPVNDKQAYDVRYWAAASRVLVPDPVTAAVDDPARIASFAEEIRTYIRDGGKLLKQ